MYIEITKKNIAGQSSDQGLQLIDGFVFLLGHFPEFAHRIQREVLAMMDPNSPQAINLGLVFLFEQQHPQRSRFLLNYLGASACNQMNDYRLSIFNKVLACPECHGALNYCEEFIKCSKCKVHFSWGESIPQLVPKDCNDPEEYPEFTWVVNSNEDSALLDNK